MAIKNGGKMPPARHQMLEALSRRIRARIIQMSHDAKTPHVGSALSCVDLLVAAYWEAVRVDPVDPQMESRDRFIFSKGHAIPALYVALAYRGFFPEERLHEFAKAGSAMTEQPSPGSIPGVELATGSLGHGLSVGIGMALAGRIKQQSYHVFVLMSDGECNEGSVWEAAMFAAAQKLANLTVMIDYNKWQATGRSREIMALEPFAEKWRSFGWCAYEVNGHNLEEISTRLKQAPDGSGKPVAVLAHTIKGKGVSFMEDNNDWHYRIPNTQDLVKAKLELGVP